MNKFYENNIEILKKKGQTLILNKTIPEFLAKR